MARRHRPEKVTIGAYLIKSFYKKVKEKSNIEILCNATVSELLTNKDNK